MSDASRRLPPLNPLRAFEAAARHRSFTKAAEELNVTQGAVSRHVRALEDRLGFPLFVRTPQGLELQPSSHAFAQAIERAFMEIAQATERLVATRSHSVLTVRAYTTFLIRWLIPRLPDFQFRHPDIEVRVVAASDSVNFEGDLVDVGIRYGDGAWSGWRSHLLFSDELHPVCSPGYLEATDANDARTILRKCRLLHHNLRPHDWPDWLRITGLDNVPIGGNSYIEDLSIIYESACSGLGLAILQKAYVETDLAAGRLICPFETALTRDLGYHIVCPCERADVPKIKTFRDWILSQPDRGVDDSITPYLEHTVI